MKQTAQIIQQNLKEVGIEVNLDEREWAAFVSDWFEKNVEMYMMGIAANTGSPEFVFPNQWVTDGAWNAGGYSNPTVDELFAKASQTIDDDQRRQMYEETQQILADDVAAVPLFHMKLFIAMKNTVHGFQNHPLEHSWVTNAWVEQ
jgi:peptide/nickel transport system substrate-binding protein